MASDASRFEATDTLKLNAGRDVLNVGSDLKAGGNASVTAGRDVVIASQTEQDDYAYQRRRVKGTEQTTLQYGSNVDVGGNLAIDARRDIAVVASTVSAAKDLIAIAGTDLTLVASKISAGNEAYVHADNELSLLAAQDSNYSLYDMSKKGGWGSKKTQRDEVTQVTNVGSEIKTGGDLTLQSGGDQKYQAAKLDSGGDIAIVSGGAVTFEAVKDLRQESHEKSKSDLAWNSAKGKGNTDETLRQTQMVAQGKVAIQAVDGLKIDIKKIDQHSVSETIDVMVKADPQLAWLKDAEKRGDVDWRQVQEMHDSFKYSHSGLGQGAMLAIIIIVTALTAGAGSVMAGGAAGATAGSGTAMAAGGISTVGATAGTFVGAGWGNLAATAVIGSATSGAVISAINNKGNLGAVVKDVTSSQALKGYVVSGISGGYVPDSLGTQLAVRSALNTVANGGKFKDNVVQAAIGMAADGLSGAIYNKVGDALLGTNLSTKVAVHAIVGGLIGEAAGGDFRTAALAAGANEALISLVGDKIFPGDQHERLLAMTSQLVGMTVAAAAGGDDKAQEKAAWVAQQATVYNNLKHAEAEGLLKEIKDCRATKTCGEDKLKGILGKYEKLSAENSDPIKACKTRSCVDDIVNSSIRMDDPVAQELLKLLRQTTYDVPGLLQGNPGEPTSLSPNPSGWGDMFAMDKQVAYAKSLKEGWLTPQEAADLDRWNASTTWVDRMYGHKLEPGEKAAILTELGTAGAAALMSGRGSIGAAGPKGTIPENMSPIGAGRSGAFNEAKRQSGIPTSQQPSRVLPNVDKRGNPQPGKIYEFEVPAPGGGLKTVRIRDDAGGHDFGSGNSQNRGPHFNDKTGNHYDY